MGIWSGILFCLTGSFGLMVIKPREPSISRRCLALAFLSMNIVSALASLSFIIANIFAVLVVEQSFMSYRFQLSNDETNSARSTVRVIRVFTVCIYLIELVSFTITSSFGCRNFCKGCECCCRGSQCCPGCSCCPIDQDDTAKVPMYQPPRRN